MICLFPKVSESRAKTSFRRCPCLTKRNSNIFFCPNILCGKKHATFGKKNIFQCLEIKKHPKFRQVSFGAAMRSMANGDHWMLALQLLEEMDRRCPTKIKGGNFHSTDWQRPPQRSFGCFLEGESPLFQ